MKTDNPAARTLKVLRKLQETPMAASCKDSWCAALGIPTGNDSNLLMKLGAFMANPTEAVRIMNEKFPALRSQTDAWHLKFMSGITCQQLNAQLATFSASYRPVNNDFLEVMNHMIGTACYDVIPEQKISDSRAMLSELIDSVLSSNLEEKVKNYVVKSIRRIISALEDYEITGSIPVIESIEIMAGHVFTNEQFRISMNSDIGNKIFGVIGAIADAMAIAAGVPPTLWKQIGSSFVGKLTSE
ncbi:hypothetical protein M1B35_09830 [Pseudomonas sp. MAFF 302046]|uniref:Uncharacterized protein n=1 Tax=Pseudomonas morbosilactucae TaxID=2938197 RepID=A0ABT0JEZ2_9PSED|nr:hypothetical protein [Pseudomonas morbosilactucae]MCK9814422.1 hypothetical protein [Pseudomonas morbosilactucae]